MISQVYGDETYHAVTAGLDDGRAVNVGNPEVVRVEAELRNNGGR